MKSIENNSQGLIENVTIDFPEYCRGCNKSDIEVDITKERDILGADSYNIEIFCGNRHICDKWNNRV